MSNPADPKTEARDDSPRASARKPDTLEALTEFRTEVRRELAALRNDVRDLLSIVQAALPASLVQLSAASITRLINEAPHTRVRLLAPFTSSLGTFPVGEEFQAGDSRIRTHGMRMVLGLAPVASDAPAKAVQRIIEEQTMRLAEEAKAQERQRLANAAAASRAATEKLEAAARAS